MEVVQMLQQINGYNNIADSVMDPARKRSSDEDNPHILITSSDNPQYQASRMISSVGASTTGRGGADIFSYMIQRNNTYIDAVVHRQSERLTAELKQAAQRGLAAAVAAAEQQAAKVLRNKEAELSKARQMNLLLQERVYQLSKERQRWKEAAMQSEIGLSAVRKHSNFAAAREAEEGNGGAEDAESCCFEDNDEVKKINNINGMKKSSCKACMEKEVSVLLLPCRHLCLCRGCEPKVTNCPICSTAKNATFNVFLC